MNQIAMTHQIEEKAVPVTEPEVRKPQCPTFKRWWYHKFTLDIRPACWSLRNRPDEWERNGAQDHYGSPCIRWTHKPSKHHFLTDLRHDNLRLAGDTQCNCSSTQYRSSFTTVQRLQFMSAADAWFEPRRQAELAATQKEFVEHFI